MKFTALVEAAKEEHDLNRKFFEADLEMSRLNDKKKMLAFNEKLHEISSDLSELQAEVESSSTMSKVEIKRGSFSLHVEVYFDTKIFNMFLLSIREHSLYSIEERSEKASTADEAIKLMAREFGNFISRYA